MKVSGWTRAGSPRRETQHTCWLLSQRLFCRWDGHKAEAVERRLCCCLSECGSLLLVLLTLVLPLWHGAASGTKDLVRPGIRCLHGARECAQPGPCTGDTAVYRNRKVSAQLSAVG